MGEYRTNVKNTTLNCVCEECGVAFHKSPGDLTRRFCSFVCRQIGMRCNGPSYYRKFKRDVCSICAFVPLHLCQLDVHHIDGDRLNNKEDNLQTVCANCHRYLHKPNQDKVVEGPIENIN